MFMIHNQEVREPIILFLVLFGVICSCRGQMQDAQKWATLA